MSGLPEQARTAMSLFTQAISSMPSPEAQRAFAPMLESYFRSTTEADAAILRGWLFSEVEDMTSFLEVFPQFASPVSTPIVPSRALPSPPPEALVISREGSPTVVKNLLLVSPGVEASIGCTPVQEPLLFGSPHPSSVTLPPPLRTPLFLATPSSVAEPPVHTPRPSPVPSRATDSSRSPSPRIVGPSKHKHILVKSNEGDKAEGDTVDSKDAASVGDNNDTPPAATSLVNNWVPFSAAETTALLCSWLENPSVFRVFTNKMKLTAG
ncbi:hypothetical protein GLOTRDRAFT_129291 [Gloeophyllum trabeum ATCC 11539]|uniref:Uncharacterized protein n=1 Tax=Gloeophyllum trabeum (strain ATCC 11539 / FP-39264 / Madison 617) TaxID=670483 RepID=S7Q672_GLOTA|nr:uncharacterized protein GLOTRDRAFT_129291 [Gloeophyllum trabeum ATCC 11539]EPQ54982.1 hypothetical protein GLOTRDRAFT_129291 [Gloeophyllum trabeum ATCC 11539]